MTKRKMIVSMLLSGILCMNIPQAAFAYAVPEMIEIGLESVCKNSSSASISCDILYVGTLENDQFIKDGMLESQNGITITPIRTTVTMIAEALTQREAEQLVNSLRNMEMDACLGYLGADGWTVYIQNASRSEVEDTTRMEASRINEFQGICLQNGQEILLMISTDVPYAFSGEGEAISINGNAYRGYITFALAGTVMTAVNVIDLEEYLYGVIPSEMPASYEIEALKAQTLAARTYAMTKLSAHQSSGYELCDSTHCQVYKGFDGENKTTNAIVDATAGEIICYNGMPIEAVFSASSGGYTENSENVWYNTVPYLRAVPELAEYGDNRWTRTLTLSELDTLLQSKGEGIGSAEDIVITKLSTGGRVQEMQIVGSSGTKTLTKEEIRTYFSSACGSLPSKLFTINGKGGSIEGVQTTTAISGQSERQANGSLASAIASYGITAKTEGTLSGINGEKFYINSVPAKQNTVTSANGYEIYDVSISTVESGVFVFEGMGNGHGVGLSQNGAQGMAQLGYTYEEIIKHYYTGVTIEG